MWTPRRVLLLILGVAVFGTAFGVYARYLGWIDGLPQLPDEMLTRRAADESLPPTTGTITERKLQLAFGQNCLELSYHYKIELPSKGIVFAADAYSIEADGRIRFTPFSLATLKEKVPGEHPEINTAHGDVAYLEFDKPVRALSEIGTRRIVAAELVSDPGLPSYDPRRGRVHVVHNRGTATTDDDLSLVTPGPVSYREAAQPDLPLDKARPQLWTGSAVELVDRRSQPQPTTVTAQGMQIYLAVDGPAPAKADKPKGRGSSISGVRRVVLPANVKMNLWMDPGNGFLTAGAAKTPAPKPGDKPPERTNVQITTLGPFTYDVNADGDLARFDRLPPAATQLPNFVKVVRPQAREGGAVVVDQLESDVLELQFAHKPKAAEPGKPAAPKKDDGADRGAVEWVHAWGDLIVLTSDEEKLDARGNDLFHDAKTKATVLRGTPEMVAVKDGNEIHAPELHLFGAGAPGGQQAKAVGAGYVKMYDRGAVTRAVEARWKESLVYRKEDGKDLLTLVGDATFDDRDKAQMLKADSLKLWLVPEAKPGESAKPSDAAKAKPADGKAGRPKPQKLDALGHVTARSPDLHVDDTDALVLLFTDAPPRPQAALPVQPGTPAAPAPTPAAPQPAKPEPGKKPVQLRAKRVQAFVVVRPGEANELDTVHCEEEVRVHQDAPTPQEKPVDMKGQKITLKHRPEGNVLQVTGNLAAPGEVHFPDLSLLGPSVTIDQVENSAHVNGIGSMRMVSTTGLGGEKLKQPSEIVITWKQEMRFNGQLAQFHGNVQAEQDATTLLCNNMQVTLNKPVQFNRRPGEARQGKDAAAIDRVTCDGSEQVPPQPVLITERVNDERGRLVKFQQIESSAVMMYKEQGQLEAGPGSVRILQLGPKDEQANLLGTPQPAKKREPGQPAEEEHKLTWVRYADRMVVDNLQRTAKFYKNVEVLHFPSETPGHDLVMNKLIDKLPQGGMYLRCENLKVYSTRDPSGKASQSMVADGQGKQAYVQAHDFFGWANVIKYDESKGQVIFEGGEGSLAQLNRVLVKGGRPDTVKAKKIVYNRATGAMSLVEGQVINTGG